MAEDRELEETKVKLCGSVGDDDKGKVDRLLQEFGDLMDGTNGHFKGGEMTIELEMPRLSPNDHIVSLIP